MADGTYGGYDSGGYGGYGGWGGGYSGEAYGMADDLGNPYGLADVDRAIANYTGESSHPGLWKAGTILGTLALGPLGGLGVQAAKAISDYFGQRTQGRNNSNDAQNFIESLNLGGGNSSLSGLLSGPDMGLGPTGGGWGSGNYLANVAGLAGINYQNPTPEQYQWLNSLPQPAKPSAVSMIVDQTMPWIDRDASGNITGSYRWKQREGQEKLTW